MYYLLSARLQRSICRDSQSLLARNLAEDVFRRYREAQDAAVEQRLFDQLQRQFQNQLEAARVEFSCKESAGQDNLCADIFPMQCSAHSVVPAQ